MLLGMEVGLGPGDFVFDGHQFPQKKGHSPPPNFWPCLLWSNDGMDQDATWYRGKPRPRRRCVRWGRSSPLKGAQPPVFGSYLLWPNVWMNEYPTWHGSRPRPRPLCVRRERSSPRKRGTAAPPPLIGLCLLWHGRPSQLLTSFCYRLLTQILAFKVSILL